MLPCSVQLLHWSVFLPSACATQRRVGKCPTKLSRLTGCSSPWCSTPSHCKCNSLIVLWSRLREHRFCEVAPVGYRTNGFSRAHENLVGCIISFAYACVSNCTPSRTPAKGCKLTAIPQHNMHFGTSSSTWWSPFGNACPATLGVAAALHLDKPMQWSTTHKYISIGKTSSLSAYRRRPRVRSSYRAPTVCSKAVFGLVLWRSSMWTSKWTSSWESKENCGATPERPSRPDVKSTHLVPALRPCNCLRKRPQYGGSVPHLGLGLAVQLDGPRSSLRIRPCLSTRL